MTDKLTRNAKQILSLASDEATVAKAAGISPLHILQGIVRCPESTAFQTLVLVGVEIDAFRAEVLGMTESNPLPKAGDAIINKAENEAKTMKDPLVGSEHLLLAIAAESMGELGLLLAKYSISVKQIAAAVPSLRRPKPAMVGAGAARGGASSVAGTASVGRAGAGSTIPTPSVPRAGGIAGAAMKGVTDILKETARPPGKGAPASTTGGAVISTTAAEPVGPYPHARRVGNLLFLSGVGPRKRGTKQIPGVTLDADGNIESYDIEAQIRSCFENVLAVLEESGSSWANIVDVTAFLTNMKADFPTMNRLWAEFFPRNQPCRTTVEVGALPTPIAFEVKVIATLA